MIKQTSRQFGLARSQTPIPSLASKASGKCCACVTGAMEDQKTIPCFDERIFQRQHRAIVIAPTVEIEQ
jgi:hypothetical protein